MKTEKNEENIERENQEIELIKSKLFETMDILDKLEIKDFSSCDGCGVINRKRTLRKVGEKYLCWSCYKERKIIIPQIKPINISLSDMKEEDIPHILDLTKHPISVSQPITGVRSRMKKQYNRNELLPIYKEIYSKILEYSDDREIYPEMSDEQFKEFISPFHWMGIPSFQITKKEMVSSKEGHLSIGNSIEYDNIDTGKYIIFLWFNGIKAVDKFVDILNPYLNKKKDELISLLKNLDSKYKIKVDYAEIVPTSSPIWETVKLIDCKDLDEETINNLLLTIQNKMIFRNERQKELSILPKKRLATMAVGIGEVVLDLNNPEELKNILDNMANLMRLINSIPNAKKINQLKINEQKLIDKLKLEKAEFLRQINGYIINTKSDIKLNPNNDMIKDKLKRYEEQLIKLTNEWEEKHK